MPGIIRFCCYSVDQVELVHAVAVEVDRRNANPPKFSKPVRIEMGIVEIAEEKVDRPAGVSPTHLIQDLLSGIGARLDLRGCIGSCDVHEPTCRKEIGSRFNDFMPELYQCGIKICCPQTGVVLFGV
jgi:hypothetical protein